MNILSSVLLDNDLYGSYRNNIKSVDILNTNYVQLIIKHETIVY